MIRHALLAAMALGLLLTAADARSHPEGRRGGPAMVARVLPAVASIPTRQIERDQFDQSNVTPGWGSGIIADRRGYVLTNDHVSQGFEQIKIALADERTFRAALVGCDPFTDFAVLKIEGANLPVAPLGPDLAGTVRRESEPAAGVRLRPSRGPGRADQAHRAGRARGPCGAGGRRRRHGGRRSAGEEPAPAPRSLRVWRVGQTLTLTAALEEYR